jgi:hypothetical protein
MIFGSGSWSGPDLVQHGRVAWHFPELFQHHRIGAMARFRIGRAAKRQSAIMLLALSNALATRIARFALSHSTASPGVSPAFD